MKQNQFFSLLPLIEDQKWAILNDGTGKPALIRNEKDQCPICAIVDVLTNGDECYTWDAFTAWRNFLTESTLSVSDVFELSSFMRKADNADKRLMRELHVQQ